MTPTNLADLAFEERFEDLEQAWSRAVVDPEEVAPYIETLRALCERGMAGRALSLASPMVDALAQRGRIDDALRVGMALVRMDAHNDGLSRRLSELAREHCGAEPWYPVVRELSGLDESAPTREALEAFERTRRYTAGHVVYHRAGWGEGVVEAFDPDRRELRIRFASGRVQDVPLSTAIESMTPLEDDDLRTMLLTRRDELARLAEEDPALVLRKTAKIYRGRVASGEVKGALSPALIPAKRWASFWKKAKAAAALDPWLQVEGSTTRPVFVLRDKPLTLADEARRAVRHCGDLGERVALIRHYLDRGGSSAQDMILQLAQEIIEKEAAAGSAEHAHLLDGILLLEEHDRHPSASAASELRALVLEDDGELRPENLDLLGTQHAREHAVLLLPDALGEGWAQLCIDKLTRMPASVVESLIDLLAQHGHAAKLLGLWDQVAPYPRRHPNLTYHLGRLYADGAFDQLPDRPDAVTVARVLLHLLRVLSAQRRGGDAGVTRLQSRLTSVLVGRRALLPRVLETIDREHLATFLGICERGGSEFPHEVADVVLRAVAHKHPDLTAKPERPFWEDDAIYVTRQGLEARREQYRRLVDELIPANSKAIGAAAALGDLSENSEWESAMEEQRNLTGKAAEMDKELRRAKLIEAEDLPEGTVAPGTAVRYTVLASGETETVRILGPWDAAVHDAINYMAPLAKPLLGRVPGDTVEVPHETGSREVRIDAVEPIV